MSQNGCGVTSGKREHSILRALIATQDPQIAYNIKCSKRLRPFALTTLPRDVNNATPSLVALRAIPIAFATYKKLTNAVKCL